MSNELPPYLTRAEIHEQVWRALDEDLGNGDLTAALVPEDGVSDARVITREAGVLCGGPWFEEVFRLLDERIRIDWELHDGDALIPNQVICSLHGPSRALLTGERTALNFLQTLSGTATVTRRYVDAVADTGVEILDTRKTLPGLRKAQKYAVRCGGGRNHRIGLYDGILVKENHIAAAGSIGQAVDALRAGSADVPVEVEVENLPEVRQALAAGVDLLLLDNMDLDTLREAVEINAGRAKLEVSGGLTLETIRAVADSGVDFISVGALTKHLHAIDLSMRFAPR